MKFYTLVVESVLTVRTVFRIEAKNADEAEDLASSIDYLKLLRDSSLSIDDDLSSSAVEEVEIFEDGVNLYNSKGKLV